MDWPPLPDYGCFPRWPENGQSFIHPQDVSTATQLIPSERVFKRFAFDDVYYHFAYGRHRFRLRPAMWLSVTYEGIDIGDQVETTGLAMNQEQFIATVWGMYYVARKGCILYRLRRGERVVPHLFASHQIKNLTDKTSVRPGTTNHPSPSWDGSGETLQNWNPEDK